LLNAKELGRLCVVLVRTRNPLNIGATARAMSNFGFTDLRVVKPYEPAFREARSAIGAAQVLAKAKVYASVAEAVAGCRLVVGTTALQRRELHHSLRRLESGAPAIREELRRSSPASRHPRAFSPRVAILFGSEKTGLSNQALSHCHWLMRIPTTESNFSMNLGQAVAVCLYELIREVKRERTDAASAAMPERATASDTERITSLLLDALQASGYLHSQSISTREDMNGRAIHSRHTVEKLRRLVCRLDMSSQDAEVWLGILRQIAWKLHATQDSQ
jgi:TrmH family RNA methyltransferase